MIERLEVAPGPGTVIRFGHVVAWTSAAASPSLVSFLTESARNLADSPVSGDQLADHLAGVLGRRDPEPHVPFVVIGPSENGWAALLHGPVQIWDGVTWTTASPRPGWMRASLWPRPGLSVSVSGTPVPAPSPDSTLDLEAGVVPGGGFLLLPAVAAARAPDSEAEGAADREAEETEAEGGPMATDPETRSDAGDNASGTADQAPPGVLDLRDPLVRRRVVAYPPLPPGGDPSRPVAGAPVVAGVPCPRGHLNRPGMLTCARCASPIGADGYQVSGTRPALGCLITDQGSVHGLDSGYLVGCNPHRDPTVRGRLARPLVLRGDDVATSHAEIRLHDWDVVVTDRASGAGTHIYPPGATEWERLSAFDPRVLQPGTHMAFGQRVVTFVTPWTLPGAGIATRSGGPVAADQETRPRN